MINKKFIFIVILGLIILACYKEYNSRSNNKLNSFIYEFDNAILYIEFILDENKNLSGNIQFFVEDKIILSNSLYGQILNEDIILKFSDKNIIGKFDNNKLKLSWPYFENSPRSIELKKGTLSEYNNKVNLLIKSKAEEKVELEKNNYINDLVSNLSDEFVDLEERNNTLCKNKFNYEKINEALSKVKESRNIYLNCSDEDKNYYYEDILYYIEDVEYYFEEMESQVNDIYDEIEEINKLIDNIKIDSTEYKRLTSKNFIDKNFENILNESEKIINNYKLKMDEYLNNGKAIVKKSYSYK